MKNGPHWEPICTSSTQEIPYILWNRKLFCYVHNSWKIFPPMSHIIPVKSLSFYFIKIQYNVIFRLHLNLPSDLFPSAFFTKTL